MNKLEFVLTSRKYFTVSELVRKIRQLSGFSGQSDKPPYVYVMQVMIFGSISSQCSAQYEKNLNAGVYKGSNSKAYKAVIDIHYVDDYVDSFDDVNEAINVTKDVIDIHRQAGFKLIGFASNSKDFLKGINKNEFFDNGLVLENLCKNEPSAEKVFGMRWRQSDDSFCFVLKFAKVSKPFLMRIENLLKVRCQA